MTDKITLNNRGLNHDGYGGTYQVKVPADTGVKKIVPPLGGKPLTVTAIPLSRITHGAVAGGPFIVGEIITGDASGARAQVVEIGTGFLLVTDITGDLDAVTPDTITGGTSGASAAISAKAAGAARVRQTTAPENDAHGAAINIEDGTAIFTDWDNGLVTAHTTTCLASGVTGLELAAVDVDCIFEINA